MREGKRYFPQNKHFFGETFRCTAEAIPGSGGEFGKVIVPLPCNFPVFYGMMDREKSLLGGDIMSKHIVTINSSSLQDSIKFEGCSECQTSCQSACKTSCTIGNLICTTQEEAEDAERA